MLSHVSCVMVQWARQRPPACWCLQTAPCRPWRLDAIDGVSSVWRTRKAFSDPINSVPFTSFRRFAREEINPLASLFFLWK